MGAFIYRAIYFKRAEQFEICKESNSILLFVNPNYGRLLTISLTNEDTVSRGTVGGSGLHAAAPRGYSRQASRLDPGKNTLCWPEMKQIQFV